MSVNSLIHQVHLDADYRFSLALMYAGRCDLVQSLLLRSHRFTPLAVTFPLVHLGTTSNAP